MEELEVNMRTRQAKSIALKKKKEHGLSLSVTWKLYFLETIIKKASESKYNDKIIFNGNMFESTLNNENPYDTEVEILVDDMALNKFSISKMFNEILNGLKWKIDNVRLISFIDIRKYQINIICQEQEWEQVISMIVSERKKPFPTSILSRFEGLFYKGFLIHTYSIGDIVAESFLNALILDKKKIASLRKIELIYRQIIVNDNEIRESIINLLKMYNISLDIERLNLAKKALLEDETLRSEWEKRMKFSLDEIAVLLEGIINVLK